jgi:biotin synthase
VEVVRAIKSDFDMAVTLSVGERTEAEYRLWRQAGADRYLLKIETTNPKLYDRLHPGMSLDHRMRCSAILRELGYQNGSGSLVGLEGQTLEDLADDLLFFRQYDFDMVGIGVFIPHDRTPLAGRPAGDLGLALRMVALTRILLRDSHIPATTAIGTIGEGLGREQALKAGANVVMPNFTPPEYRGLYDIYPGRLGLGQSPCETVYHLKGLAESLGRTIGFSKGHSNKAGSTHLSAVCGQEARSKSCLKGSMQRWQRRC